jgi:uncharacterized protein YifN (PemK superfamily)
MFKISCLGEGSKKGKLLVAINFHPKVGQILMCDFSKGFEEPEMVKKRPVLVLTPSIIGRGKLVTIICLSTTKPAPIQNYHYMLPKSSLPNLGNFQSNDTWVKADMIYTVGFNRLDAIKLGGRDPNTNKRVYFTRRLGRENMKEIYSCLLCGLNLGGLSKHL